MIYVIATVEVAEGKRDAFLEIFHRVIPSVLAEKGCMEYGPAVDLPTDIPVQIAERRNVVTIMEKWESLEALKAHLTAPHMLAYRKEAKGIVTGMKVEVLKSA
jgi:quinol monooxygenase YgiN